MAYLLLSRKKFDLKTIWALAFRTLDFQDGNLYPWNEEISFKRKRPEDLKTAFNRELNFFSAE